MMIQKPSILKEDGVLSLIGNEYNIMGTDCFNPGIEDCLSNAPGGQRFILHPEFLYAYVMRYKDEKIIEYYYSRNKTAIMNIREDAFAHYLYSFNIESIEELTKRINYAENIRNTYNKIPIKGKNIISEASLFMDEDFLISLEQAGIDKREYI